jgi:P22 coat protein - gene protein 5.
MATNVSAAFQATFDAEVKIAYEDTMKLRNTCRVKTGVVGKTHHFPYMSGGMATERQSKTMVTPIKAKHDGAVATLADYSAADFSDVFDLAKMPFDERKELSKIIASAMGRRSDQIQLDALAAGANSSKYVAASFGSGGNDPATFNLKKLLRLKRFMDDANVPEDDRFLAIDASVLESALLIPEMSSSDFNVTKALCDGSLKKYAGFQFILIGSRKEGGLKKTKAGDITTVDAYAWHKQAVGFAIGMEIKTEISYENLYSSWLINGLFSAGAVVVDPEGVYKMSNLVVS